MRQIVLSSLLSLCSPIAFAAGQVGGGGGSLASVQVIEVNQNDAITIAEASTTGEVIYSNHIDADVVIDQLDFTDEGGFVAPAVTLDGTNVQFNYSGAD